MRPASAWQNGASLGPRAADACRRPRHGASPGAWLGAAVAALVLAAAEPAMAQLDPLLFLKRTEPNVILVVDTSARMQRDADGLYYDTYNYSKTGAAWEASIGVTPINTMGNYRRVFVGLAPIGNNPDNDRYVASTIRVVGDLEPGYATFGARTRLAVARNALARAVQLNKRAVRFGLVKMRQSGPAQGAKGNAAPLFVFDAAQQPITETGKFARWAATMPSVLDQNGNQVAPQTPLVKPDAANANDTVLNVLSRDVWAPGALIPAGREAFGQVDAPVQFMLDDARIEAVRLITADQAQQKCRNTAVVMVVGGGDGNTTPSRSLYNIAATFVDGLSGRRVPIYMVAIAPSAAEVPSLREVATASGGQFLEITKAMIERTPAGEPVPELVQAVNIAIQHAYAAYADFNTRPTAERPYGPATEHQTASPIVGTVNLENARDINGASLPDTVVTSPTSGNVIPQRSNVMITSGFAIPGDIGTPGFPGRLRAFRVYRPVADSSKVSGYKFVSDGTPLWVATTPQAAQRNIYTMLPNGGITSFTEGNAQALAPYLNVADAATLINYVRGIPLGAVVDSTPAVLDPPSLDPPPDAEYPAFLAANKDRRSMVFVGGNDGMMHAIDARLGVEVWAFIPFNLLPKLRTLREGQSLDEFRYFVDSSPKLADVKIDNEWRSYLFFGEGPGGTFYQALDVTLPGLGQAAAPAGNDVGAVLNYFSNPDSITFKWSYPRYEAFDCTLAPYGDLSASATAEERTVGETWSDPAVGQVQNASGPFVLITGSGFLSYTQQTKANRGGASAPIAGTTFYVIDVETGDLLASENVNVSGDTVGATVDNCSLVNDCTKIKNAIQADPVATGPPDSRFITQVYVGDLHGRLWRFDLTLSSGGAPVISAKRQLFNGGPAQPVFSSMAVVNVGGTQQYIFFGTGSDLLPSSGVSQSYKLLGILDSNGVGSQKLALDLEKTDSGAGDEKVSAFPAVAGDIVFFTTTTFKPATPCSLPDASIYAMTFIGGAAYDNTGDNKISKSDTPKVKTVFGAGRATAPFVVDQHLIVGIGGSVEIFGDPEDYNNGVGQVGVRILSWREIR